MNSMRLAILGSTRGTTMLSLINAIKNNTLNATIEMVVCNNENALILQRAQQHDLNALCINTPDRERFEHQVNESFIKHKIDYIVLIGFMRILTPGFVARWQNKMINIHPSLLPLFAGERDLKVHEAVIAAKHNESGCTVHYVTEAVDQGPILLQKKCMVHVDDTPESLKERVQSLEAEALIEAISKLSKLKETT